MPLQPDLNADHDVVIYLIASPDPEPVSHQAGNKNFTHLFPFSKSHFLKISVGYPDL
jgi:hypothetical protein